jgi:hypothetical protein
MIIIFCKQNQNFCEYNKKVYEWYLEISKYD